EVYAGEKARERYGEWLPGDTLEAVSAYVVAIKGPLTTPIGGGYRSLNVSLRQQLDLYACIRPVRYFEGVPSPVKRPKDLDVVIFKDWGYQVAREEFPDYTLLEEDLKRSGATAPPRSKVLIKDRIADSMFQQLLIRPREYSVLATQNLNGDYLSDAAAAQAGG